MNSTDLPDDPNAPRDPLAPAPIKNMRMFFIDNQAGWPADAVLAGDLVIWPDDTKYPSFVPVASARHPAFDGQVIVQAGARRLIVSLCPGAKDAMDVRRIMSAKGARGPEQYQVAIDGIVQRVMLHRASSEGSDNQVHPFALLQWMQRSHPKEAAIIQKALKLLYAKPEAVSYQAPGETRMLHRQAVHEEVEGMLDQLTEIVPSVPTIAPEHGDGATTTTTE